jgi:hypothetical protein
MSFTGVDTPNVEATNDPGNIFTASFSGAKETWPEQDLYPQSK